MTSKERLTSILKSTPWLPQPGPQLDAFNSKADITMYGGAAGGGKTDLAIGLALTKHRRTLFVRREATQLSPVVERIAEIIGTRDGLNMTTKVWNLPGTRGGRQIVLGGVPVAGDESKFQGASRDLLVIDEAANLLESQIRFLMGWVRSNIKGQRCRTLMCSNPPTSADGEWIIRMFAPWLDKSHENPAANGELRWFASIDGEDTEVGPDPFKHNGEKIIPMSRTFIASKVQDNKFLANSGYLAVLQSLPEPLRSMMLNGDFLAGQIDDEWQVVSGNDVDAAMQRWKPQKDPGPITALGVDPSRGGRDATVICTRHKWWVAPLDSYDNLKTGGDVAAAVIKKIGHDTNIPVFVDSIGVGTSVVDHLQSFSINVIPINGAAKADDMNTDISGTLGFANKRAEIWWRVRELLSDETSAELALPQDNRLKADLCTPRFTLNARGILIEDKQQIYRRLGRSPDSGDALAYCCTKDHASSIVQPVRVVGGPQYRY